MRIFLDANVLFSAAQANSNIAQLVGLVVRDHTAVTSELALAEASRNVQIKRPAWSADLAVLAELLEVAPSMLFELSVELDEKDRPILCAAIRSRCELLVTGDRKHFGHLFDRTIGSVTVVSVLSLAQRVLKAPPGE